MELLLLNSHVVTDIRLNKNSAGSLNKHNCARLPVRKTVSSSSLIIIYMFVMAESMSHKPTSDCIFIHNGIHA